MNKAFNKIIRNNIVLSVLSVVAVSLLTISVSYSLFQTEEKNTTNQVIELGTLTQSLTGTTVVMTDIQPESDNNITSDIYTFRIQNTGTYDFNYVIYLSDKTSSVTSTYPGYTSLTSVGTSYLQYVNYKLDGGEKHNLGEIYANSRMTLFKGFLKADNTYTEMHTLQFWLDESAPNILIGTILALDINMESTATIPSFANYLITSKYTSGGDIYYHTTDSTKYKNGEGSLSSTRDGDTKTYAELNANDLSYRYAGSNPSNYVCFGTSDQNLCKSDTSYNGSSKYLYRVVGLFKNNSGEYQPKLILANRLYNTKTSAVGFKRDYDGTNYINTWPGAALNQWLNGDTLKTGAEDYYPTTTWLSDYESRWTEKIAKNNWHVGGYNAHVNVKTMFDAEILHTCSTGSCPNTMLNGKKVGLLYISDYLYGASPTYWNYITWSSENSAIDYRQAKDSNWLFTSYVYWLIQPFSTSTGNSWRVYTSGYTNANAANLDYCVRPVIYLNTDVQIDESATSDGSASAPYMLKI